MDTPKTRGEFEFRFHLLREAIRNEKMQFPASMRESLLKLRYLPNGRLDFLNVDETARLQANTMLEVPDFKPSPQEEEDPVADA